MSVSMAMLKLVSERFLFTVRAGGLLQIVLGIRRTGMVAENIVKTRGLGTRAAGLCQPLR